MWLCIAFPVRHQFINLIKVVLLSIKINVISNKNINFSDIINFWSILLNEANGVSIFILSHI